MDENVKKVSDHIEDLILNLASEKLNPSKLFSLTIQSIEYLETEYPSLTGSEKKLLLIEAFKDILSLTNHLSLSPDIKIELSDFVENDLDAVIESIIQVSKGDFKINEITEQQINFFIKCLMKLLKCCLKKKHNSERP
jgi:hypothetical protein